MPMQGGPLGTGYKVPTTTGYKPPSNPFLGIRPDVTNWNRGGGRTNTIATTGAKAFKDALGIPNFQDIMDKMGGGSREFGNSGLATEGAAFAKDELGNWKKNLGSDRASINKLRAGISDPTKTAGFKNTMRLNNERLGAATEDARQADAEATSRRGYSGGYNPASTERSRLEAIAMAGYSGVNDERKALQDQFGNEAGVYGSDVAGYGHGLSAYTDLTKTAAELPTKWLDAYANLLGGAGNFGDIFRTTSGNVQYDENNQRADVARKRQDALDVQNSQTMRAGYHPSGQGGPAQNKYPFR